VLQADGILEGLFAAGEITAGMHGVKAIPSFYFADFIIGARLAGQEAAAWARL
jgi:succinate dehydrogenase/fumarate reductase flavoprotein subunit